MKLSPRSYIIVTSCIAIMVVGAALMVLASYLNNRPTETEDKFDQIIQTVDAAGLTVVGISPVDLYGEEYTIAAIVCPGETPNSFAMEYGLNPDAMPLPEEGVPSNQSYLLLGTEDRTFRAAIFDRNEIDLCSGGEPQPFSTRQMIPLVKDIDGVWKLAS